MDGVSFLAAAGLMAGLNIWVVLAKEKFEDLITVLFRASMLTG